MNPDNIFPIIKVSFYILCAALILAAFIVIFIIKDHNRKKHTTELKAMAAKNGWKFYDLFDFPFLRELAYYTGKVKDGMLQENFNNPFLEKSRNVIQGNKNRRNFAVFEQRYYSGAYRAGTMRRHERTLTVFAVELKEMNLPVFCLEPDSFDYFSPIGVKNPDINFYHSHPKFSSNYLLYGRNENQIKNLFLPSVLAFFEQSPLLRMIAGGRYLVIYQNTKQILAPYQIIENLNLLLTVANAFKYRTLP